MCLQIINSMHTNYKLLTYLVFILQALLKALYNIRGIFHSNLLLKGGNSDLVTLKTRTEKHVCELMGKLKPPEELSIGRRWSANNIPSMLGLQPDPPK